MGVSAKDVAYRAQASRGLQVYTGLVCVRFADLSLSSVLLILIVASP